MNNIIVERDDIGKRIDQVLAKKLNISRAKASLMIEKGLVCLNYKKMTKTSSKILEGVISYEDMELEELDVKAENIPLNIVFQDEYIVVIDKQPNLVVHPAPGNREGTLVNALLYHIKDMAINDKIRPGIVHRLDKDTSGLIVVAKNDIAHNFLADQFKNREVEKVYCALVEGSINPPVGIINFPLARDKRDRLKMAIDRDGKSAKTSYKKLDKIGSRSLLEVSIESGRTHQIRVHLSSIGFPVVGDILYGKKDGYDRHFLHCTKLAFKHPKTKQMVTFTSEIPSLFYDL